MSVNIGIPNINAPTPEQQIPQIRSYLYQLAEQLNWALSTIESGGTGGNALANVAVDSSVTSAEEEEKAQNTFNSIKSLIIKSADIVSAYYEEIDKLFDLSGKYVAEASFPNGDSATFIEQTNNTLFADNGSLKQVLSSVQTIEGDIENLGGQIKLIRESEAYIKSGELATDEDGYKIYGLEVGQTNKDESGEETFNKFARFTADRLSFYDQNDNEVAYISDYKLYITHAIVSGSFTLGGFVSTVNPATGSVVKKWAWDKAVSS